MWLNREFERIPAVWRRKIGTIVLQYKRPALAAICILAAFAEASCHSAKSLSGAHGKRIVVLGIDGMDPGFLERHWADLPKMNRLRQEGEFKRLATTTPPQSPVAWSTFITGMKPTGHGIFDFVERDPNRPLFVAAYTRPRRDVQKRDVFLEDTRSSQSARNHSPHAHEFPARAMRWL